MVEMIYFLLFKQQIMISLENYVINKVGCNEIKNEIKNEINVEFVCDKPGDVQIKLCDFVVAEICHDINIYHLK